MSRLSRRPVAKHIMAVLEKNNDVGMCLAEIQKGLIEQGWNHYIQSIRDNCILLEQNGLIVAAGNRYTISSGNKEVDMLKILDSTPFKPKHIDHCDRCGRKFEYGDKFYVRSFSNVKLYLCEECHEPKITA